MSNIMIKVSLFLSSKIYESIVKDILSLNLVLAYLTFILFIIVISCLLGIFSLILTYFYSYYVLMSYCFAFIKLLVSDHYQINALLLDLLVNATFLSFKFILWMMKIFGNFYCLYKKLKITLQKCLNLFILLKINNNTN